MKISKHFWVVCLLTMPAAANAAAAGTFFWSNVPFRNSTEWPGRAVLTADPAIVYTVDYAGLHRSDDGGRHWKKIEAPATPDSLDVSPHDPETLFTDVEGRLLKSADGGASWQVALQNPRGGEPIEVLPSRQEGRVYAVSAESIWESTDGGIVFERRGAAPGGPALPTVELDEAADGGLYLVSRGPCSFDQGCDPGWRIDRSADHGRSWTLVDEGDGTDWLYYLLPHPADPAGLYLLRRGQGIQGHLYYSPDRGATFASRGLTPTSGDILAAGPDLPETLFQPGIDYFSRSDDGGRSWSHGPQPPKPPGIFSYWFAFYPPSRVVFQWLDPSYPQTAETTVYASADGGASWSPVAVAGPFADFAERAAASGSGPSLYVEAGNLLARSHDGGATWQNFDAPWGVANLVGDPLDGNTLYVDGFFLSPLGQGIHRSRDGGASFQLIFEGSGGNGAITLIALRQGDATTLVATLADGRLARSTDGGDTWQVGPVVPASPGEVPRLHYLVASGGAIYGVARLGGPVYRSADFGETFAPLGIEASGRLAGGGGLIAELDEAANALRISDGGPWQTMPLPFPLPDDTVLRADSQANLYLYGWRFVLRSSDRGRSWQSLSQGLPESGWWPTLLAHGDRLYFASTAGLYAGDFAQGPPLALVRGRFEARVRWRLGPAFPWTDGAAASISDQSGVFRFFSPERAEVAVQILDGRVISGKFWTFVASMTDVEVEVEVKDRLTGDTWRHHQPPGQAVSTANFDAFPREYQPTAGGFAPPFGGFAAPAGTVLLAGRFEVSVSRPEPYAFAPVGRQLFGDSAGFTFFDPSAMDLLVNLIDGRAINGKWWVFAGSLTDQEFTITVRDTLTGAVKTYPNPVGGFAGFGDTNAF
jgi:photosystem II stability/assembly factor-like uncharacterized protein